jgi:DNA-binding SARP family transcriptional activator
MSLPARPDIASIALVTNTTANARFILRTLGGTRLESLEGTGDGSAVLGAGKPFALLVYLALAPRRTASRESLIDLLWANAEPDRARQTLRQTLSQLRQLLGDDGLTGGTREVTLGAAVRIDLDDFFAAMRDGRHAEATALYTGPFLAEFAVPGGESFDRWADLQRDRVRGAHHFALDAIVRSHLEAGHPREAEPLARALRDADPFDQSAWRMVIESLLSAGNALEAKLEAEAFERFLADEEREPEPSVREVILRARQVVPPAPAEGERLAIDLIGREREFSALVSAWSRAAAGHAQIVEIIAPAGLGKTRLLEDLHHRLRARGSNALFVRAVWGERTLPFALSAALAGALAPLRGAAGVSPSAARVLVGLDPALSSHFNAAAAAPESSAEGRRERGAAGSDAHRRSALGGQALSRGARRHDRPAGRREGPDRGRPAPAADGRIRGQRSVADGAGSAVAAAGGRLDREHGVAR